MNALKEQHEELVASRAELDDALEGVATERQALDTKLAELQDQAARDAQRSTRARRPVVHAGPRRSPLRSRPRPPHPHPHRRPPAPSPPAGAVSPHHNDPFLVCTRQIESGGDYSIVSSSGLYYGAYQFLPSTWNAVAAHAGRTISIGVLPSRASAYDQDEMAWVLYQWQGNGPWGGRC